MKLTQKELAKFVGVSDAYICYLETEKKAPPPYHTVLAMAQVLKIDADLLWRAAAKDREKNAIERSRSKSKARRNRYAQSEIEEKTEQEESPPEISDSEIRAYFEQKDVQMTTFSLFQKHPRELTMEDKRVLYHVLVTAQTFISNS